MPTSWFASVKSGSSVAGATAKLTIIVAFGLLAALLSPAELEPELELLPHAARTRTARRASRLPAPIFAVGAPLRESRFIGPPSGLRFIEPSSIATAAVRRQVHGLVPE